MPRVTKDDATMDRTSQSNSPMTTSVPSAVSMGAIKAPTANMGPIDTNFITSFEVVKTLSTFSPFRGHVPSVIARPHNNDESNNRCKVNRKRGVMTSGASGS